MSEVANFRKEQAAREYAAQLGLSGYRYQSRHDFITKRMETCTSEFVLLAQQGKVEEAFKLIEDLCEEIASDPPISEERGLPLQVVSHPSPKEIAYAFVKRTIEICRKGVESVTLRLAKKG